MSRTARLGAFIVSALLILAAAVFFIGDRQFLFSRTYQLKAPFDTVAGLADGAAVRAGGVRVGTITAIRLPKQSGDRVLVEMELDEDTRQVIKQDSVATIETEGLLGNKYLAVSFGSKEGAMVRDGDTIQSQPPIDYADLARKANEIMDTTKVSIENVNAATADMKSITAKINGGEGTIGALINDKQMYRTLNATTSDVRQTVAEAKVGVVSFQDNMEALKHNWFFRGFFKDRGYFDSRDLTAHTITELPKRAAFKKFVFSEKDLFGKPDVAKLKKGKPLDSAGKFLEQNPFGLAVVVAYAGAQGEQAENLKLTQARAMVVRQYLAQKFKLEDVRIKTKGAGETREADTSQAGHVEILVFADGQTAQK